MFVFRLLLCSSFFLFSHAAFGWNPLVVGGRCNRSGEHCSGTIGNSGQKEGSCCDPSSASVAQCSVMNACVGGYPYLWKGTSIPVLWWFNFNGMAGQYGFKQLTKEQVLEALKTSWDVWAKTSCTSFQYQYRGETSKRMKSDDRHLVLFFPSPREWALLGQGDATLAFTRPVANKQGELQDADIAFNPLSGETPWRSSPKEGLDLIRVAAHEIGHALGLAHTHLADALMFYANRSTPFVGLSSDDRNAICSSYPKRTCRSDKQCGSCWKCQNAQCIRRQVSPVRRLCQPCAKPSDCGGVKDLCIRLEQGNRCAQACYGQGCCPKGYRCADIGLGQKMCLPISGVCPDTKCKSKEQCAPGESCQKGVCRPAPVAFDSRSCQACRSDSDCAKGHACIAFPDEQKRCAQPCAADNFCPKGFLCRAFPGRYCTPKDWICPCSRGTDCLKHEVCQQAHCRLKSCGFRCLCSKSAPCPKHFRCVQGDKMQFCVQNCARVLSCFQNFRCAKVADTRLCLPKGAKVGESCDDMRPCEQSLSCVILSNRQKQGVCLEVCSPTKRCMLGGACLLGSASSRLCGCSLKNPCRAGFRCQLLNQTVGVCVLSTLGSCGNGVCEPRSGEDCSSCTKDCLCDDVSSCQSGLCVRSVPLNSAICLTDESFLSDGGQAHCSPASSCNCSVLSAEGRGQGSLIWLLFSVFFIGVCRRKASKPFFR